MYEIHFDSDEPGFRERLRDMEDSLLFAIRNMKSKIEIHKPPVCCGRQMYSAGGDTGGRQVLYWRCQVCGQETHDVLDAEVISSHTIKRISGGA